MAQKTVTVGSRLGLHARPAAVIARAAAESEHEVTLRVAGGAPFNAASAMMIIVSGAQAGAEVLVESDDSQAMERIAELIASDLDAPTASEETDCDSQSDSDRKIPVA